MKYTGQVYRPPFEARSLLLQVTRGCSHNSCTFCTMYRDVPFGMESYEQIEEDLKEARERFPAARRVFLENGDAFCLSAERLARIAEMIHEYLPLTEIITMYASVLNIRDKTDAELKMLRDLGIDQLNVGVESGLDDALKYMNKGYTAAEAVRELKRLQAAGMHYAANVILGGAGSGRQRENAETTAALLNETRPYLVFTGTLHSEAGCPLHEDLRTGAFQENTFREYLEEEECLLENLKLHGSYFFGLHPSNVVQVYGVLDRDQEKLLNEVRRRREALQDVLDLRPLRGGEGAVLL